MKCCFDNWHTKDEMPEIKRQFIANCHHDYTFYICGILNENGYMKTDVGNIYWNDFKKKCDLRYWYYIDEIGKENKNK